MGIHVYMYRISYYNGHYLYLYAPSHYAYIEAIYKHALSVSAYIFGFVLPSEYCKFSCPHTYIRMYKFVS